jgi:hypothetical protein
MLAFVVGLMLALPASAGGDAASQLDLGLCAPDQNRFTLDIDNEFFPLPVGGQWTFSGEEEGQTLGMQITVLDATETLSFDSQDVTTRVVEEREWFDTNADGAFDADEELIEVSLNYFAQTREGTVCYFGEEVDIYENGEVVSHEGSWRADEPGNAPGIYMPTEPEVGMRYQMEVAPGIAVDEATIVASGVERVLRGRLAETIEVVEVNPLDGSESVKVYAEHIGMIRDSAFELIRLGGPLPADDDDRDGHGDCDGRDWDRDRDGDGDRRWGDRFDGHRGGDYDDD